MFQLCFWTLLVELFRVPSQQGDLKMGKREQNYRCIIPRKILSLLPVLAVYQKKNRYADVAEV